MKKILFIFGLLYSFCINAQTPIPSVRSTPSVTALDTYNGSLRAYKLPVCAHVPSLNGGLDSLGSLCYVIDSSAIFYRDTDRVHHTHIWSKVSSIASSSPTWQQTLDVLNGSLLTHDNMIGGHFQFNMEGLSHFQSSVSSMMGNTTLELDTAFIDLFDPFGNELLTNTDGLQLNSVKNINIDGSDSVWFETNSGEAAMFNSDATFRLYNTPLGNTTNNLLSIDPTTGNVFSLPLDSFPSINIGNSDLSLTGTRELNGANHDFTIANASSLSFVSNGQVIIHAGVGNMILSALFGTVNLAAGSGFNMNGDGVGTTGQVLTSQGAAQPIWTTPSSGGGGNTIYTGDGFLAGARIVGGNNNNITFTNIPSFSLLDTVSNNKYFHVDRNSFKNASFELDNPNTGIPALFLVTDTSNDQSVLQLITPNEGNAFFQVDNNRGTNTVLSFSDNNNHSRVTFNGTGNPVTIFNMQQGSGSDSVVVRDINGHLKVIAQTSGGSGTVTNVSSADGNATVASPTTTPVITIVSAPKWLTSRTLAITGDLAYTSPSIDGTGNVTAAGTLATVNSNVGSFTNANITVNAKGLITAASNGSGGGGSQNLQTTFNFGNFQNRDDSIRAAGFNFTIDSANAIALNVTSGLTINDNFGNNTFTNNSSLTSLGAVNGSNTFTTLNLDNKGVLDINTNNATTSTNRLHIDSLNILLNSGDSIALTTNEIGINAHNVYFNTDTVWYAGESFFDTSWHNTVHTNDLYISNQLWTTPNNAGLPIYDSTSQLQYAQLSPETFFMQSVANGGNNYFNVASNGVMLFKDATNNGLVLGVDDNAAGLVYHSPSLALDLFNVAIDGSGFLANGNVIWNPASGVSLMNVKATASQTAGVFQVNDVSNNILQNVGLDNISLYPAGTTQLIVNNNQDISATTTNGFDLDLNSGASQDINAVTNITHTFNSNGEAGGDYTIAGVGTNPTQLALNDDGTSNINSSTLNINQTTGSTGNSFVISRIGFGTFTTIDNNGNLNTNSYTQPVYSSAITRWDNTGKATAADSTPVTGDYVTQFQANSFAKTSTTTNGIYTPTLTNVTNISSSAANQFTYSRQGSIVTYAGSITITTSLATAFEVDFSLPIASAFASDNDLNGTGTAKTAIATNVVNEGDAVNDRGECEGIGLAISGSGTVFISGQYIIK